MWYKRDVTKKRPPWSCDWGTKALIPYQHRKLWVRFPPGSIAYILCVELPIVFLSRYMISLSYLIPVYWRWLIRKISCQAHKYCSIKQNMLTNGKPQFSLPSLCHINSCAISKRAGKKKSGCCTALDVQSMSGIVLEKYKWQCK